VSSPRRRRIDEIGDESRRRILDAAEELFAERGFDRTSFVDVSQRSGISRGSIPWHFKNKHGLVIAVLERAMGRFLSAEQYEKSFPSLAEILGDYAAWARTGNSALMFMVLTEAVSSAGAVHTQYQEFLRRHRYGFELWLRAHRPEGADPEVAEARERTMATALNGAVIGVHLQWLIDPEGTDLEGALQAVVGVVSTNLADVWAAPAAQAPTRKAPKGRRAL
jgi:TetR/AcrR family acrAB operon transcriptional repressor